MVVGVCRVHLFLPENDSLKGKRAVVRKLLDRTRNKFNVAAAEVGALSDHRHAELGFVVVSNDNRHANAMLDKISDYCERTALAEIGGIHVELIPMGKSSGAPMMDPEEFPFPETWRK